MQPKDSNLMQPGTYLACPFHDVLTPTARPMCDDTGKWLVFCYACGTNGPQAPEERIAIDAWKRAQAVTPLKGTLRSIEERVEKREYLNALAVLADYTKELLRLFSTELKR